FGRYWLAVPALAIAGSLARKKIVPAGPGALPTGTPLFVVLLVGVVVLVGALTYVPALALGPVVEHLTPLAARWWGRDHGCYGDAFPLRPADPPSGRDRLLPQADAATPGAEPGDVRRLCRLDAHLLVVGPGAGGEW